MSANAKPNEIQLTRVYDYPVEMVWEAFTDPEQVQHWWGPRGFTLTTHGKEMRPGGFWKYTMHGPDGTDYENHTIYHEVEEQKKLVYDHGGNEDQPPLFKVTVFFNDIGGKTEMDMTLSFASAEIAANMKDFIKEAGGNATWDRLAEYLAEESGDKKCFVINRSFDAPLDTVFEMWTNSAHLSQWLPPVGFTMELLRDEIRVGGSTFFKMSNDDVTMYGRFEYQEIEKPDCLVYTQQFCDAEENLSRHPLAPVWPATMRNTVHFTAEGAHQTRVTVECEAIGDCTAEEVQAFLAARGGMTQGWTGSFDKLEGLLVEQQATA